MITLNNLIYNVSAQDLQMSKDEYNMLAEINEEGLIGIISKRVSSGVFDIKFACQFADVYFYSISSMYFDLI